MPLVCCFVFLRHVKLVQKWRNISIVVEVSMIGLRKAMVNTISNVVTEMIGKLREMLRMLLRNMFCRDCSSTSDLAIQKQLE
jgi:hypothetical protein